MKKGLIAFGIVLLVIVVWGFIEAWRMPDNRAISEEEKAQNLIDNYELLKEEIIDPESVDFDKFTVKSEDTPENLSKQEYVVVRKHRDNNKTVWEIEGSVSNLEDEVWVYENWDDKDIKKIPIIVFAISDYREKTYQYVSGGVGTPTITSEGVTLYFYNPKTDTVFMTERMEAEKLPESTSTAADHTKSLYEIEQTINKCMGKFSMPDWMMFLLTVGGAIGFFAVIGVFMGLKSRR